MVRDVGVGRCGSALEGGAGEEQPDEETDGAVVGSGGEEVQGQEEEVLEEDGGIGQGRVRARIGWMCRDGFLNARPCNVDIEE